MKTHKSRAVWTVAVVVTLSLLAGACSKSDKNDNADKTTTTATASGDSTTAPTTAAADTSALKSVTLKLNGQGSSLQDTFEQKASSEFNTAVSDAGGSGSVTYTKTASKDGKKALADKTSDFAGSDSTIGADEKSEFGSRTILYFPIIASPISMIYNLKGVTDLRLSAPTISKIFQGQITSWNDPAIVKDNPDATLPSTKITVAHRSDGSGTTNNFTKFLAAATPDTWKLGSGDTVNWPSSTQGAEKSTGVTSIVSSTSGALGYADLADAAKANLDVATIENKDGKWVKPTPAGAAAALDASTIGSDLTYIPAWADGATAYPITSPTYVLVDAKQKDQAHVDALKAYLNYMLSTTQGEAQSLFYAPLPSSLDKKAIAQLDSITVG
ncbi:MAG TPA: phosphate ABC transporter substrate-binding protein PstS [Acidimicrobiales bacterium]